MPTYRLTAPGQPAEPLEADSLRNEGAHLVLRGLVLVMGRLRQVVLRQVPHSVRVEQVHDVDPAQAGPPLR